MEAKKRILTFWLFVLGLVVCSCTTGKHETVPESGKLQRVGLALTWQHKFDERVRRIVGMTDNKLILYTYRDRFVALDITSGTLAWSYQLSGSITDLVTSDDFILKDGLLVFTSFIDEQGHRRLTVLDTSTGQELWGQDDKQGDQIFGFTVGEQYVYLSLRPHYLACDRRTGQVVWQSEIRGSPGGLLYDDNELVIIDPDMSVLDANTGKLKHKLDFKINSTLYRIYNGVIYFFAFGKGQALDTQKNIILWEKPVSSIKGSGVSWVPLLRKKKIYLGLNGSLGALDASTGEMVWGKQDSNKNDTVLYSNPVFIDDTIYTIFSDGSLRTFNDIDGTEMGRVEFGVASADAALYATNQMLFVSLGSSRLYAFTFLGK